MLSFYLVLLRPLFRNRVLANQRRPSASVIENHFISLGHLVGATSLDDFNIDWLREEEPSFMAVWTFSKRCWMRWIQDTSYSTVGLVSGCINEIPPAPGTAAGAINNLLNFGVFWHTAPFLGTLGR